MESQSVCNLFFLREHHPWFTVFITCISAGSCLTERQIIMSLGEIIQDLIQTFEEVGDAVMVGHDLGSRLNIVGQDGVDIQAN